ncbi:MAG: 1-acyl-sn-glycerol-3-phosphate acyltransferase [Bacteroidales bacterium]|nr:1-acyl-sn-glycerol-3-phosphate acyltransferase [Bacteroidales bacterium]
MDKWERIWKKRETIYIPSRKYTLIRTYSRWIFNSFYKRIYVRGFENVSRKDPVIFAPNHQCALMDALAIVYKCGTLQPVFLARQDVFKAYLAARILTILKIMPVYRDRDGGAEAVKKNEKIFDIVNETLLNKKQIGIMPEASHGDKRRLKNTMKGTYRLAFRAQETFGDESAVKLVPVGLEYTDHAKYQAELLVNYGDAIEVNEYMPLYRENPAKALLAIKKRYEDEVKKLMINIDSEEYYDSYEGLRIIYGKNMQIKINAPTGKLPDQVYTDKRMIELLEDVEKNTPQIMQGLSKKVLQYFELLKKTNLRNWVIRKGKFSLISLIAQTTLAIIFFPFFIYGYFNNYFLFKIPVWAVKKVKDRQFHSSVKFVTALFTVPIFYLLQFLIVLFCTRGTWWIEFAYLLSIPISGWWAKIYYFAVKKLLAKWRFTSKKKEKDIQSLIKLHQEIIEQMDEITSKN